MGLAPIGGIQGNTELEFKGKSVEIVAGGGHLWSTEIRFEEGRERGRERGGAG